MRLGVYTDYVYHRRGDSVFTERAFSLFLFSMAPQVDRLTIVGRLGDGANGSHYRVPDSVDFVALPHYESLMRPGRVAAASMGSVRRFWAMLDRVDVVWLLGPHPFALLFALLALARGRRVALGVRQDLPTYIRSRRPGSRWAHRGVDALEATYRAMARFLPVVVVGPQLAHNYRHARDLLEVTVSLVRESDILEAEALEGRRYADAPHLTALSVGRLEAEKNSLLLADVLARLRRQDDRWRLIVYGEGPLRAELSDRLAEMGLAESCALRGYVPWGEELMQAYRDSHAFLHVSLTEGLPQVLFEAYAARLPVVATAVGGVADAAGGAAVLIPPDDAQAAADALTRVGADPDLRAELTGAGVRKLRAHTLDSESARVCQFLSAGGSPRARLGSILLRAARGGPKRMQPSRNP